MAPANGIWQGSFFFDPSGIESSITVSGQNARLDVGILKGSVLTSITVDDTVKIVDINKTLVFGWGTSKEESPVTIRGVPNSKTVLIDPAYVFQNDHAIGSYINVITDLTALRPRKDGTDLAIYLTSPSAARAAVEEILRSLAAAGIIVNFVVLAPTYKYIQNNPYITDDDPPSA